MYIINPGQRRQGTGKVVAPGQERQGCPSWTGRGGLNKSLQACAGVIGRWSLAALALLIRVLQDPLTILPMWSSRSGILSEVLASSSVDKLSISKQTVSDSSLLLFPSSLLLWLDISTAASRNASFCNRGIQSNS